MKSSTRSPRRLMLVGIMMTASSIAPIGRSADAPTSEPVFKPNYGSLDRHEVPAWFDDAKLGIFVHWGLYSVPAWAPPTGPLGSTERTTWFRNNPYAEWYLNTMRMEGSPTWQHHRETYGAEFDYYQFAGPFDEALVRWDPAAMAELFASVHARYVVLTTKHHDGFTLWPSAVENPHLPEGRRAATRDVVGELTAAVRGQGMRMGLYYSGGIDWSFHPIVVDGTEPWNVVMPPGPEYAAYADAHWRELIARYHPDVLWNDIRYPEQSDIFQIVADYYNAQPDGLVNNRFGRWLPHDFTTPEYRHYDAITPEKWESCRGIGYSFGYNAVEGPEHMLSVDELVDSFVDIVSKNGNLLLNVGPMPDGTISPLQVERLRGLGRWLDVNGEAIFGTRPWVDFRGELRGDPARVRFTHRADTTFAILLDTPEARTITLTGVYPEEQTIVRLLGCDAPLSWRRVGVDLEITLPDDWPEAPAHALAITPQPSRLMKK